MSVTCNVTARAERLSAFRSRFFLVLAKLCIATVPLGSFVNEHLTTALLLQWVAQNGIRMRKALQKKP